MINAVLGGVTKADVAEKKRARREAATVFILVERKAQGGTNYEDEDSI